MKNNKTLLSFAIKDTVNNVKNNGKLVFCAALLSLIFIPVTTLLLPVAAEMLTETALSGVGVNSMWSPFFLFAGVVISIPLFVWSYALSLRKLFDDNITVFKNSFKSRLYSASLPETLDTGTAFSEIAETKREFMHIGFFIPAILTFIVSFIQCLCAEGSVMLAAIICFAVFTAFMIIVIRSAKSVRIRVLRWFKYVISAEALLASVIVVVSAQSTEMLFYGVFAFIVMLVSLIVISVTVKNLSETQMVRTSMHTLFNCHVVHSLPRFEIKGEVHLHGVTCGKGAKVNNLSASFPVFETTALLGGSNSGKSTVLKLIKGDLTCNRGYITFDDSDVTVTHPSLVKSIIGNVNCDVYQGNASLKDMLAFSPDSTTEKDFLEFIHEAGLSSLERNYGTEGRIAIKNLGYEDKVRLLIAKELVRKPKILLVDGVLDIMNEKERKETVAFLKATGITVIIATGNNDVAKLCSNVVEL